VLPEPHVPYLGLARAGVTATGLSERQPIGAGESAVCCLWLGQPKRRVGLRLVGGRTALHMCSATGGHAWGRADCWLSAGTELPCISSHKLSEIGSLLRSWQKLSWSRNSPPFTELEGSLLCSQETATGEPDESSPHSGLPSGLLASLTRCMPRASVISHSLFWSF
jgi:hypothetical protein